MFLLRLVWVFVRALFAKGTDLSLPETPCAV
jgi:hypothetical protein